jgi:hypothetical protein
LSFTPLPATPDEFRALIRDGHARWAVIIREAGLKLD